MSPTVEPLVFLYTNYKGETEVRHVIPERVWFGVTPYHPDPQWFLGAFDLDRKADRNFAFKDVVRPAMGLTGPADGPDSAP